MNNKRHYNFVSKIEAMSIDKLPPPSSILVLISLHSWTKPRVVPAATATLSNKNLYPLSVAQHQTCFIRLLAASPRPQKLTSKLTDQNKLSLVPRSGQKQTSINAHQLPRDHNTTANGKKIPRRGNGECCCYGCRSCLSSINNHNQHYWFIFNDQIQVNN